MTPQDWQKRFQELTVNLQTSIESLDVVKDMDVRNAYQRILKESGEELIKLSQIAGTHHQSTESGQSEMDEAQFLESRSGQGV